MYGKTYESVIAFSILITCLLELSDLMHVDAVFTPTNQRGE